MATFPKKTILSTTSGLVDPDQGYVHPDCASSMPRRLPRLLIFAAVVSLFGPISAGVYAGVSGFQLPGRGQGHGQSGRVFARAAKGLCEQAVATGAAESARVVPAQQFLETWKHHLVP
jgi:hypothetical protein